MTLIIVAITVLISIICFSQREWFDKLLFSPYRIYHKKQYYRFITHGFVHADWIHLIVNMFVLYSFGQGLEYYFKFQFAGVFKYPTAQYLLLYFSAMIVSSLTTLKKYREMSWYSAVGASGAVSAVVFTCIFFDPWQKLMFYAIIPVPGILFGAAYLWYSHYMSRKNNDNINHDAHFIGALWGFTFPILIDPRMFWMFIYKLTHFTF